MNNMTLLEAALYYVAEWNVSIFPCVPGEKRPLTPNGFKDASRAPEQIHEWWSQTPDANIGTPTGKVNDCYVVDIDKDADKGKDGMATWVQLIREHGDVAAPTVITPHGGQHLYLRYVDGLGCTSHALGCDIDTRGDRGYVLLPPSMVNGKAYVEDAGASFDDIPLGVPPAWIVEKLTTAKRPPADVAPTPASGKSLVLADLDVSDRTKYLILHGDSLQQYPSRSEAIFAAVTALVNAGYRDEDIITVLSDPAYTLAEKLIAKGPRWMAQEIERARRKHRPRAPIPIMRNPRPWDIRTGAVTEEELQSWH